MEALLSTGKVRSIGVSNFNVAQLEKLLETATITPAVNQIEIHP
jgi:diketogulonate reductase-like aldo/keto reductase